MRQFINIVEYAHREESGSSFTHDGAKYDLNCILSAVQNIPAQMISVGRLIWILDHNGFFDPDRMARADLDAPILVTMWQNRLTVLDGIHRLSKAVSMGVPTIRAVMVPEAYLRGCAIA